MIIHAHLHQLVRCMRAKPPPSVSNRSCRIYSKNHTPFFVSDHITPGEAWAQRIGTELEQSEFGILCLTRDNWQYSWLLFEAGAIAKKFASSRVVPYLIDELPQASKDRRWPSSSMCAPTGKEPTGWSKASTPFAKAPSPPTVWSAPSQNGGLTSSRHSRPCRLQTPPSPPCAPIEICSRRSCSASRVCPSSR